MNVFLLSTIPRQAGMRVCGQQRTGAAVHYKLKELMAIFTASYWTIALGTFVVHELAWLLFNVPYLIIEKARAC